MTNNEAETVYDTMLMGFMDHEDPAGIAIDIRRRTISCNIRLFK